MKFLVAVLGVVLVFEGIPWFLSPVATRNLLARLQAFPDAILRRFGLVLMLCGLLLVRCSQGG